jgi:hypothetical protein
MRDISRFKRFLHFFSKSEWVNVFLTAVIATTGVVGIILVIQGGKDTERIRNATEKQACAANKNAHAARDFANTAALINHGIEDAVAKLDAQAKNSAASIKATQDAMRLDQRAWLGVKDTTLKSFKVGAPIEAQVLILNSGKTPALQIREGVRGGSFVPVGSDSEMIRHEILKEETQINLHPAPTIPPSGSDYLTSFTNADLNQPQYDDVMSGSRSVYIVGRVEYLDIFQKSQWMTFCLQIVAYNKAPLLRECDTGSDMSY